jgi:hypothetical protein
MNMSVDNFREKASKLTQEELAELQDAWNLV